MVDTLVLRNSMADVFQQSQTSLANHRVLAVTLRKGIHDPAFNQQGGQAFANQFLQFVLRIIATARGQQTADRSIAFVATYMSYLLKPEAKTTNGDDSEEEDQVDERYQEFLEFVLRSVRPGMVAKDKNVRFRVCQLILAILQQLDEVSVNEWDVLRTLVIERTNDKDHHVRTQATMLLSMLTTTDSAEATDEDKEALQRLVYLAERDPSADVRRAALLNLPNDRDLYPLFVSRARDVSAPNRRFVYSRVIPGIGDFRQLKIEDRENLLKWGLKDRSVSVKDAAAKMLITNWLRTVDNDLLSLLGRLDVLDGQVAETALEVFFDVRRDVLETKMIFEQEFWQELSQEGAFLVRCFNDYCTKNGLESMAEDRLPELTAVAFYIAKYWEDCQQMDPQSPEYAELEFVVEQLLMLAKSYDLSDEAGRRTLVSTLRTILSGQSSPSEAIVREIMRIHRKMAVSETDFLLTALELIEDVRDALSPADEDGNGDPDVSRVLAFMLVCLSIAEETLRLIEHLIDDKTRLQTLYDGYIQPALQSNEPSIGDRGMRCLGLICLVNREMCEFGAPLLYESFETIQEEPNEIQFEERRIIVQSICDITLTHGVLFDFAVPMFVQMLDAEEPGVRSIAAQAIAKLHLCDMVSDHDSFKELIVAYYTRTDSSDSALQQHMSFFFPVYCQSSAEHQTLAAATAGAALKDIADLAAESDEAVPYTRILGQIIDWTNPAYLQRGRSNSHATLALTILRLIDNEKAKPVIRSLSSQLATLNFAGVGSTEALSAVLSTFDSLDSLKLIDGLSASALKRARASLVEELDARNAAAMAAAGNPAESPAENPAVLEPASLDVATDAPPETPRPDVLSDTSALASPGQGTPAGTPGTPARTTSAAPESLPATPAPAMPEPPKLDRLGRQSMRTVDDSSDVEMDG